LSITKVKLSKEKNELYVEKKGLLAEPLIPEIELYE
jgi:hypothetical protein